MVDNLPLSIKIIEFKFCNSYNGELNCLPNSVEEIVLPNKYNKYIQKIPTQLKKIVCFGFFEKRSFIDYYKN